MDSDRWKVHAHTVDYAGIHERIQRVMEGRADKEASKVFGHPVSDLHLGAIHHPQDLGRSWHAQDLFRRQSRKHTIPAIDKVIFNPPRTIVNWSDGSKTIVKTSDDEYREDYGLAMAIARKYLGSRNEMKRLIKENGGTHC